MCFGLRGLRNDYLDVSVCATLQFTYVDTYPDDAPIIEVPSYEGMDDSDAENLKEFLEQEVGLILLNSHLNSEPPLSKHP